MDKKITALETQRHNPKRLNVFLDGDFAFGVSRYTGAWLSIGQTISEEKISKLIQDDEREKALQSALRFIGYKARTTIEIKKKLQSLEFLEEVVESVIGELKDKEYINDHQFANEWVEIRSKTKPRSHFLLSLELKKKGVDQEIIDSVLETIPEDIELAKRFAMSYLRKLSSANNEELYRKLTGALMRKGFSYSVTKDVIDDVIKNRNQEMDR